MTGWRSFGRGATAALAIFLVIVSFLPLWWTDRWWVRIWDFPRLQVAGLLLIVAIASWFILDRSRAYWALLAAMAGALVWQVTHFAAYFPLGSKEVANAGQCAPGRQMSVLSANVLMTNRDYGALIQLVEDRRPDVLLLLEADQRWAQAVQPMAARFPYRLSEPLPNTYGLMLWSRLPMTGQIRHLIQPDIPSAEVDVRLQDGSEIRVHAVHPEPPVPGDDSGERDAELVLVGRQVRDLGQAAIVFGDLNDVAWSRTSRLFQQVAGMRDPRVGRGLYPTFNAKYPLLRWPLDHLFVSPHFKMMRMEVLPEIGSDHFPIMFRLCLTDNAAERKVAPSASPEAEASAAKEVQKGKAENQEEEGAR